MLEIRIGMQLSNSLESFNNYLNPRDDDFQTKDETTLQRSSHQEVSKTTLGAIKDLPWYYTLNIP